MGGSGEDTAPTSHLSVILFGMNSLAITTGHCSLAGNRSCNEDFLGMVTPLAEELAAKGVLAALADGVSGSGAGREAAEYAVRGLLADYYAAPDTWDVPIALDRVLNAVNRWLISQRSVHAEQDALATTLTALVLRGRRFWLTHIGDTRAYLLRDGVLTRLTTDHVWNRPEREHVLTRALGLDSHLVLDHSDGDLVAGDVFALLTDGVWERLREDSLRRALADGAEPPEIANELCQHALSAGSADNVSAVVMRVDAVPPDDLPCFADHVRNLPVPRKLKPGELLDGLVVLELLHQSRDTLLYRVRDEGSGDLQVLKTLSADAADDPDERAAFAHEEWLARRLNARWFPQCLPRPAGKQSALYYLMTWHAGVTLQTRSDAGHRHTVPEVRELGIKLAQGLGALHRCGILHRDIKPANLHLGEDGELRILDLGVAYSGDQPKTRAQGRAGTPSFLAPEQFAGEPASTQCDLYAAGVTLYYLLTRQYPYGEIEPFQHPKFGEPTAPTRYRPDLPAWLENVLLKAVARDSKQRFETAEEFLLALERGVRRPLAPPPPTPLATRDPLAFWRTLTVISVVLNLLLLYLLAVAS